MSGPNEPKQPASSAGNDHEPDFESDALLDSLLFEELPAPTPSPEATPHKLHQPLKREFSEDDVTVVGRTEDLFAKFAQQDEDDGTRGLEDLANDDIDQLLSSMPAPPPEVETNPPPVASIPRLPEVPPAPPLPGVPRPVSRSPGFAVPRPGQDATSKPPAINPAGPPARQPFPLAVSPQVPQVAPVARQPLARGGVARFGASRDDEDERTRIFTQQQAIAEVEPAEDLLPDPFLEPPAASLDPRNSMPTLHQIEDQNSMPTVSAPQPSVPLDMPAIPRSQNLPTTVGRDTDFELFTESPEPLGIEAIEEIEEVRLSDSAELRPPSDVREPRLASDATALRAPSAPPEVRPESDATALRAPSAPPRTPTSE